VDGVPLETDSWTDTEITASVAGFSASSSIHVSALFCGGDFGGGEIVECQINEDCDDENVCNGEESCVANECVDGAPLTCDDGNACTLNSCDPVSGCEYPPDSCDDADACTIDSCDVVSGCSYAPMDCDDAVDCTIDTCDAVSGCENTPDDAFCEDGDPGTNNVCDPEDGCVECTLCLCNPDGDDEVGIGDLTLLKEEYFRTDCCDTGPNLCLSDCSGDCEVGIDDMGLLKQSYFTTNCCN
jgi:hypothetical protein